MIMTTDKKNWIEILLDFVKSENKYRNAFIVYFLIWNYDFVLLLLGKAHILQDIEKYYAACGYWFWRELGQDLGVWNWLCYNLLHKIMIPLGLAFVMPIIWNIFNSFYQFFETRSQKLKKENLIAENIVLVEKLKKIKDGCANIANIITGYDNRANPNSIAPSTLYTAHQNILKELNELNERLKLVDIDATRIVK